ncbi:MAG TPA: flagellar hook capping FlgD N-terminal domain-containing protein [Thermoguttaceae bacterium]|nr:flagellar hook capping FlgD N-terminal domain-containing protein [Thermoguttaceae bacterium]
MGTTTVGAVGTQSQRDTTKNDVVSEINSDAFLKLLITELQNQDPMEPMSNQEILQQLGQIREIESNLQLTETLESLSLGQNIATANSMIGRLVAGLTDEAEQVAGRVDGVSIVDGQPKLYVGEHIIDLKNVSDILDESASA